MEAPFKRTCVLATHHFLMWAISRVFAESATTLLLFYPFVFWLWGIWDLPDQGLNCTACSGRRSLNHWTARGVPWHIIFEHFLPPSTRCLKYLLFFSCSRPRVSHFSEESYFFLMNNGVWKPRYGLRCASTVIGACLLKGLHNEKGRE